MAATASSLGTLSIWRDAAPPPSSYTPSKAFQLRIGHFWLDTSMTPNGLYFCTNASPTNTVWARLTDLAEGSQGGNVILGGAGGAAAPGTGLVLLGPGAGASLTAGLDSVAIGTAALAGAADSWAMVAVGRWAAKNAYIASSTVIGHAAGMSSGSSEDQIADCVLIGTNAGQGLQAGSNIAIGSGAMATGNVGGFNIAIGLNAMGTSYVGGAGQYNIVIGNNAQAATYNNCIVLGRDAVPSAHSQFVIGSSGYPVTTRMTAGATAKYLEVNVNGTVYAVELRSLT